MPDTGAPWNIPYVAPSDLVRDYPSDSEDLADAIALALSAANTGIGSNVVFDSSGSSFVTSSATLVQDTEIEVKITPSTATAKVLLLWRCRGRNNTANAANVYKLSNGGTAIGLSSGFTSATAQAVGTASIVLLHSPASATEQTYGVQVLADGGTATTFDRELVAIEVAA